MYQSESVTRAITPQFKTEEEKIVEKERSIKSCLANINTLLSWQYHLGLFCTGLGCLLISLLLFFDKSNILPSFISTNPFISLIISCMIFWVFFMSFSSRKYIKKLFLELSEYPFEIRVESTGLFSNRLKIIIEENQLIGGCYVVKEKSKHITAYIDISFDSSKIVEAIQNLVIKAESTFIQK